MPSIPSSGLLVYRTGADEGGLTNASVGGVRANDRPVLEVLLFPRAAAAVRAAPSKTVFEIPVWELKRAIEAGPADRAGLPFTPRPRGEKPRLTAARTMDRLLDGACRSFAALTGQQPAGPFLPLGGVKMRRHRIVYVWACRALEPPPQPARFFGLDEARAVIDAQQRRFLDQLEGLVENRQAR